MGERLQWQSERQAEEDRRYQGTGPGLRRGCHQPPCHDDALGQPIKGAESEATQLAALNALLDRGFGKPTQPLASNEQMPAVIQFRWAPC